LSKIDGNIISFENAYANFASTAKYPCL